MAMRWRNQQVISFDVDIPILFYFFSAFARQRNNNNNREMNWPRRAHARIPSELYIRNDDIVLNKWHFRSHLGKTAIRKNT